MALAERRAAAAARRRALAPYLARSADRADAYVRMTNDLHGVLRDMPVEHRSAIMAEQREGRVLAEENVQRIVQALQHLHDVVDAAGLPPDAHPKSQQARSQTQARSRPGTSTGMLKHEALCLRLAGLQRARNR
jgi:hypothetical protein